MPTALQLPIRRDDEATQVGPRSFRKQILPVGTVPYEGKTLEFSREYLTKLADTFNARAYDQVPFVLATDDNRHTMDPERVRGELRAVELADDGLYGVFDLADDGAKMVAANPKLGVSARIVQDHPKGPALQHVLATLDPRATGMKPWEALDLAKPNSGESLIDLSDAEFTTLSMPDAPDLSKLTDAEKATFGELLAKVGTGTSTVQQTATSTGPTSAPDPDKVVTTATDAELDRAIAALLGTDSSREPVAALSAEQKSAIDLAVSVAKSSTERVSALETQLAAERFATRKKELLAAGVPPVMINLAEPILSQPGDRVIDLANGTKANPAEVVAKLLEEAQGTIDLTVIGSSVVNSDDPDHEKRRRVLDSWESMDPQRGASAPEPQKAGS